MTIFGLGNPGERYLNTRHNIGYLIVDSISQRLGIRFHHLPGRFTAQARILGNTLTLVKPLLFMNNSGIVVKEHLNQYPDDFLVVVDDISLPFGRLRIRAKGSDGGHKGLASIIYHLGTQNFPRLRVGIGFSQGTSTTEYVLSPWTQTELTKLPEILKQAADACLCVFYEGLEKAMNRFNSPTASINFPVTQETKRMVG